MRVSSSMRALFLVAGAVAVFALGWTASGILHRPLQAATWPPHPPDPAPSCSDPLAMAANANLVGEVREAHRDLALARERLSNESKANVPTVPERIATTREAWARMANDEHVTLRMPCARWDADPTRDTQSGEFGTHEWLHGDARGRADFLGLGEGEREALGQVYERTHARLWQSIRGACEGDADVREALAEVPDAEDAQRVALCRGVLVGSPGPETGRAFHEVAALRAREGGVRSDRLDARARVLYTLTGAPEALFDEMVRAFGRESAVRLVDHGLTCFDESALDLRGTQPDG